jgi:hypothetical protein
MLCNARPVLSGAWIRPIRISFIKQGLKHLQNAVLCAELIVNKNGLYSAEKRLLGMDSATCMRGSVKPDLMRQTSTNQHWV